MNNDDIKSANRKAMPKFVLLTLISTVAGGAVGYISAGLVRFGGRCRLYWLVRLSLPLWLKP